MTPPLRIAYLGPGPRVAGGVAGMATQVLSGLLALGHSVDAYVARLEAPLPIDLKAEPAFTLVDSGSRFRYDAWYSKTELTKLGSGYATRWLGERRLARELEQRHAVTPYDVVYQFSHVEVFELGGVNSPPIVVHPETHAAGELRWVRREHELARRCEPLHRRVATRTLLSARSSAQRRHVRVPKGFICPSRSFQRLFCDDYSVDHARTRVVPNPVDLTSFYPRADSNEATPLKVLFVGRVSARKGIECVVELSRRLVDLSGDIELEIVGDRTQWSDYRRLLDDLEPRVARYSGPVQPESMPAIVRRADILVQPSKYEPFGLTVGEALASGVPVVVTDEVGAAEGVSPECARVVPVDDADRLEHEVRRLVSEIRGGGRRRLGETARGEAERLFDPAGVSKAIASALQELAE